MANLGQSVKTHYEPPTVASCPENVAALQAVAKRFGMELPLVSITREDEESPDSQRISSFERNGKPVIPRPMIVGPEHKPTMLGAVPGRMSVHSVRDVEGDADAQPAQDRNVTQNGGGVMQFDIDNALPPGAVVPQLNVLVPPTDSVKVSMVNEGYVATGQTMELSLDDPAVKQIAPGKALTTEESVAAILLEPDDLIVGDEGEEATRSMAVEKDIRRTNPDLGRVSARPPTTEVTPNPSKLPVADKVAEAVKPEDDTVDGQPTTVWDRGSITPPAPPAERLPSFDLEETGTVPQTPKGKGTMLGLKPPSAPPRPPTRQTQQAEVSSPVHQEPETSQETQLPATTPRRSPPPPPSSCHPVAEEVAEAAKPPSSPPRRSSPPPLPKSNPPQGGLTELGAGVGVPRRLPTTPPPSVMGTPIPAPTNRPPSSASPLKSMEQLEAESFVNRLTMASDTTVDQLVVQLETHIASTVDENAKRVYEEALPGLLARQQKIATRDEAFRRIAEGGSQDLVTAFQAVLERLNPTPAPTPPPAPAPAIDTDALAKALMAVAQIGQQNAEMLSAVQNTPAPQIVVDTAILAAAVNQQTEQNAVLAGAMANVLQSQGRPVPQELVALAQPGSASSTKTQKIFIAVVTSASLALLATMFLTWI